MNKISGLIIISLLSAGPAAAVASDNTDVMAVVHQWVDGFNKGDKKSAVAACADETSIIDDIAPYEWHGREACAKWLEAYDAAMAKDDIAHGAVTLNKTRHLDLEGGGAYVVSSATFTYTEGGKPMQATGSTLTMSLKKTTSGWRISAWSWSEGIESAVKPSS
jgi:ketosteroid isomerase-like protein